MRASKAYDMLSPAGRDALKALGRQVRVARKRRRMTQQEVAVRAGITPPTLRSLEHGEPAATLGTLAAVLAIFGLESHLARIAADDPEGEALAETRLGRRVRRGKSRRLDTDF